MLCREWREISLIVLLVNCHDITGRIFDLLSVSLSFIIFKVDIAFNLISLIVCTISSKIMPP